MALSGVISNNQTSGTINATPIASGSASTGPLNTTTTYTLTVTSDAGQTATRTVVIAVESLLNVAFTGNPLTIAPGGSSTLSWTVSGGV